VFNIVDHFDHVNASIAIPVKHPKPRIENVIWDVAITLCVVHELIHEMLRFTRVKLTVAIEAILLPNLADNFKIFLFLTGQTFLRGYHRVQCAHCAAHFQTAHTCRLRNHTRGDIIKFIALCRLLNPKKHTNNVENFLL